MLPLTLAKPPAHGPAAAEKELVVAAGKAHLEVLEQHRRLYLRARALSLAQVAPRLSSSLLACWPALAACIRMACASIHRIYLLPRCAASPPLLA